MAGSALTELPEKIFDRLTGQVDNRRKRERREYRLLQWVAPCQESNLPVRNDFRQVRCHDISRSGVSYFTDRPAIDEFLVIGLGIGPQTIYLRCKVANCVRVDQTHGAYRIGCEFVGRVELPPHDQPVLAGSSAAAPTAGR